MTVPIEMNTTEPAVQAGPSDEGLLWGVFLCGLGSFLLACLFSDDFRVLATSRFDLGPRAVPGAIGVALLAGGLWEVAIRRHAWLGVGHRISRSVAAAWSDAGLLHAYALLGLLALYLIGLPWIGFSLSSWLMAGLIMGKLGQRWWVAGLISFGLVAAIKILFTQLFEVPLPEGLLENLGI